MKDLCRCGLDNGHDNTCSVAWELIELREERDRLRAALAGLIDRHPHRGSCCTFDKDGKVIVTAASCRCDAAEKAARAALASQSESESAEGDAKE